MSNIRTQLNKVVGKSLNAYYQKTKPTIDELKFKEEYQGRIIDCMVGEVDDNYIETPETNAPIVKLEHSKEGIIKVPSIKGKTILVDSDGNETDTPAEGCKLLSVGEDEDNKLIILSKNKNLLTKDFFIIGKYQNHSLQNNQITISDNSNYVISGFLPIEPNGRYYKNTMGGMFYDKNKNVIPSTSVSIGTNSFIAPDNAHYVVLNMTKENYDIDFNYYLIKNKEDSEVVSKCHKTEILLNEPLYEGNSVKNNILTKKYIKLILDGSENWNSFKEHTNTVSALLDKLQDKLKVVKNVNTQLKNYAIPYGYHQGDTEHFYMDANFALYLSKDKGITSLDLFKEYLSNNNFELIVELEEPIIEELPNGITLQGFDDTTMYIENSLTPTVSYGYNALIPYKEELSQQKEEVEINTLDIENNIIPYLMDMEYNLMTMEDK